MAGSPDPYLPGHGTNAYRVTRYELDLDYRVSSNRLAGQAVLHAVAQHPTSAIVLDLTGLRATKIQLDGRRVRRFNQRDEQLVVYPDGPLLAGEAFILDIRYEGYPAPRRGLWGEVGWEELSDGVLVAGQPNGAASWFPCNDHPRDKASYRITVTTDANYRAVCNGVLLSRTSRASRETWVYEQAEPMATYLATVQIGRYELLTLNAERPSGHVPQYAAVPASLAAAARTALARQPDMMRTFTNCFGPYPFPEYTVVVAGDVLEIPLEAQTLSIFGPNHLAAGLGVAAADRARARPPVVRQLADDGHLERHLAARGLCLLRGMALVRRVRRDDGGQPGPRRLAQAGRQRAGPAGGRPRPGADV